MCRVLVVSDNENIIDFLSLSLVDVSKKLDFTDNIDDAFERVKKERPDLIVVSVMVKEEKGIELCKRVRLLRNFTQPFIVFISTINDDEIEIESLDSGADDFLNYPINKQLFTKKISHVVKRIYNIKLKISA